MISGSILGIRLVRAIKIGEIDAAITCAVAIDKISARLETIQPLSHDFEGKPSAELYGAWRSFGYVSEPFTTKNLEVDQQSWGCHGSACVYTNQIQSAGETSAKLP